MRFYTSETLLCNKIQSFEEVKSLRYHVTASLHKIKHSRNLACKYLLCNRQLSRCATATKCNRLDSCLQFTSVRSMRTEGLKDKNGQQTSGLEKLELLWGLQNTTVREVLVHMLLLIIWRSVIDTKSCKQKAGSSCIRSLSLAR